MCVHMYVWCVYVHVNVENWFSYYESLEVELRLPGLAADIFTHWTILPTPGLFFWDKSKLGVVSGACNPSTQEAEPSLGTTSGLYC